VTRTVHAARLVEHGAPLQVERTPLADPGPGEVVVELAYAGVNPVDRYGALGRVAPDGPLPRTLGTEGAGTVDGRRVVVHGHGVGTGRDGTWAEAVVAPTTALVDVPHGVDLREAAAVGVAGVTAWRVVHDLARVDPSDRGLVLGAGGGVGSSVVSAVHAAGATVWGQTSDPGRRDWIVARGADEVVVSDAPGLAAAVAVLEPTVVFDALGDGFSGAAVDALAPRGRLVLYGTSADPRGELPLQQLYRKGLTVIGYGGLTEPPEVLRDATHRTLAAMAAGAMTVTVDSAIPLTDVNEALTRLAERRVRGKLVLEVSSDVAGRR
jgi:NADPH2:quinone reductase